MSVLLALDPGGRTGWSLWRFDAITPITHLEHGTVEGGLDGFIAWWKVEGWQPDVVVSETFVLDGRTPKPDITPLKIEGALSVLFPGWVGQRNVMKRHAPDAFLKEHGLWWPGKGHDRDSARHAIAWAKTNLHRPTLDAYWGRRRGLEIAA
ncbi:hypothetical protein [Agromyces larvae]|uniref:RuvC-like resolvase n=1 Tax=Agromyces larvae TaxID=2929802 RepID=A0ABY4C6T0_9MICO|nr:hypothetical protein [Agromyces larvae]UOE45901.1 hypothetical protein MTO99_09220 [Agromyces larvae]